ncbi:MAG: DNA mismatch endonuclease Vsr [Acidobacteria bacterium]|nr:DNA mismatch endonuclease Vsr [Acidobacteriota bacterium]
MRKTAEERHRMMQAIRGRDTTPELAVRRMAHRMGYRFRLHRKSLPGTPDLVFVSRRKVIFIHGCFWHAHGCKLTRMPKRNLGYWVPKLKRNRTRDKKNLRTLTATGWRCLVIWECEIRAGTKLEGRLKTFLDGA